MFQMNKFQYLNNGHTPTGDVNHTFMYTPHTHAPPGGDMLSELGQAETLDCRVSKAAPDLVDRHPARGPVRSWAGQRLGSSHAGKLFGAWLSCVKAHVFSWGDSAPLRVKPVLKGQEVSASTMACGPPRGHRHTTGPIGVFGKIA